MCEFEQDLIERYERMVQRVEALEPVMKKDGELLSSIVGFKGSFSSQYNESSRTICNLIGNFSREWGELDPVKVEVLMKYSNRTLGMFNPKLLLILFKECDLPLLRSIEQYYCLYWRSRC